MYVDKGNLSAFEKSQKFQFLFNKNFIEDFQMNSNRNRSKKRGPDSTPTTVTRFPCKLSSTDFSENNNSILCDLCKRWIYIKCTLFIILTKNI